MSETEDLIEITKELGNAHQEKKNGEKELAKRRTQFFDAATADIDENSLATKTVDAPTLDIKSNFSPEDWVRIYHPGWEILYLKTHGTFPDDDKIVLREDPTLKKYVFVNPEDGQVYQRNAIEGAPSLDDESLGEDHPEILERITKPVPMDSAAEHFLTVFANDFLVSSSSMSVRNIVYDWIEIQMENENWPRVVIPQEEWPQEDLAIISDYLIPGPISLRLESPRKAKPEEIDGTDDD